MSTSQSAPLLEYIGARRRAFIEVLAGFRLAFGLFAHMRQEPEFSAAKTAK